MSVSGIAKQEQPSSLPLSSKQDLWIVGSSDIAALVQNQLKNTTIQVETDTEAASDPGNLIFCKDSLLQRPDGSLLLPSSISDFLLEYKFQALLPISSKHFLTSKHTGYGTSFHSEKQTSALKFCSERKFKVIQGKTCVERGNCFYISSKHAIVGCHSVVLSLLALEKQNYDFSKDANEDPATVPEDFIRLARNQDLLSPILKIVEESHPSNLDEACSQFCQYTHEEYGGILRFKNTLISTKDLDDPEIKKSYIHKAKELFRRFKITEKIIAEELQVSELTILQQNNFHIDMDICISPERVILMNDEGYCLEKLNDLKSGTSQKMQCIFDKYIRSAEARLPRQNEILLENIKTLSKYKITTYRVPGVFEASQELTINFLNGIFFTEGKNTSFLTNGVADHFIPLQTAFCDIFQLIFPKSNIHFIEGERIQNVLTRHFGGISCLTGIYKSQQ